jgi:hypothetical protein
VTTPPTGAFALVADAGVPADGIDAVAAKLHAAIATIWGVVGLVEMMVAAVTPIVPRTLFALRDRFVELSFDFHAPTAGAAFHPAVVGGGSRTLSASELLSVDGFDEFLERLGGGR